MFLRFFGVEIKFFCIKKALSSIAEESAFDHRAMLDENDLALAISSATGCPPSLEASAGPWFCDARFLWLCPFGDACRLIFDVRFSS